MPLWKQSFQEQEKTLPKKVYLSLLHHHSDSLGGFLLQVHELEGQLHGNNRANADKCHMSGNLNLMCNLLQENLPI